MKKAAWLVFLVVAVLTSVLFLLHTDVAVAEDEDVALYGRDINTEIPLEKAIAAFNAKYPDANPLTSDEVIAAIRSWDRTEMPVSDGVLAIYQRVVKERILPKGMYLSRIGIFQDFNYRYEVDWKDLTLTSLPPGTKDPVIGFGYNYRIRARFISSRPLTEEEKKEAKEDEIQMRAAEGK